MDPQLEQYIQSQLMAGYTPEQIKQALVSSGHSPQDAEMYVKQVLAPPTMSPAPTPAQPEPQKMQPQQMPAIKKPEKKPVKWDTPPIPKWAVIAGLVVATVVFMYLFYTFVVTTLPA
jgi:hypothetical protein